MFRRMLARLQLLLWPDRCPWHGVELIEHGFKGYNRRYTCPVEECCMNDAEREFRRRRDLAIPPGGDE